MSQSWDNVANNMHELLIECSVQSLVQCARKTALQGSGLVRTVGSCAQRRVALMPQAIELAS